MLTQNGSYLAAILLVFCLRRMKNNVLGVASTGISGQHARAVPSNRFIASVHEPVATMPTTPASEVQFISEVRSGLLPAEAQRQVRDLAARLELTVAETAVVLATPERTFARRMSAKPAPSVPPLTKVQSERLLFLTRLAAHGLAVFEDQGKFNRWLRRPLALLQNQTPLQLLDTATGFRLIDQLLGRIEYGVYS